MKTGEWKFYFNYTDTQKTIKYVLHYSHNVPEGAASFFYADDRPYAKGQYTKGYADGKWEFYGSNEKQAVTVHYFAMGKPLPTHGSALRGATGCTGPVK
jgi:antitoxin component YwqK of YwqJK toxin-antitoxin module